MLHATTKQRPWAKAESPMQPGSQVLLSDDGFPPLMTTSEEGTLWNVGSTLTGSRLKKCMVKIDPRAYLADRYVGLLVTTGSWGRDLYFLILNMPGNELEWCRR